MRRELKRALWISAAILLSTSMVSQAAPYCQKQGDAPNIYATLTEKFVMPMDNFFSGYNLTYMAQSSDVSISQTGQIVAMTEFQFQNPLSHDIWKNTDGSAMHVVLDENNNKKVLFFGEQKGVNTAIQWSNEYSIAIPLRNCFSATLIRNDTAAIDCFDTQGNSTYNVWYTVRYSNLNPQSLVPQNFTDSWRSAVVRVDKRKTVKYFSSQLLGDWRGSQKSDEKKDVKKQTPPPKGQKYEVLYLFSAAPWDKTYPNDMNLGSEILVYGVNFDSGDPRYPNGQMIFEMSIDGTQFQLPALYLQDLSSTTSGVFFLTTNGLYGFQYGFQNIFNIESMIVTYESLKFAIVQEGYRFSIAIVSPTAIFEYDWNIPAQPVPRGVYEAPQNANTKVIGDCEMNFAYIMLNLEYETFFFQRNQHQVSNTAYIINYRPNPSYLTRLLYNDRVISIAPGVTNVIALTPSYLKVEINEVGSQMVELTARSEDALGFQTCTVSLTVTGVEPSDPNVYQTNMAVQTLFDGMPGRIYSFPISSPFAGSNIEYTLQSLGETANEENKKAEPAKKLYELKGGDRTHKKFLEASVPEEVLKSGSQENVKKYLESVKTNNTVFSLTQAGPAVGTWPDFQNAQTTLYSYSWYDNLNNQYFYTFNQAQTQLGYQIFISVCELIDMNPNNFNCSQYGTAQINGPIKSMAAASFFGSNLFVVSYETSVQGFVSVFNFTGELFHTFPVAPGPENLVTDIDIIGSYCFLSQPILRQVSVYWFNPNEYFPGLYNLTEETIGNWPGLGNGGWSPVGVWGHQQLPNLIYVELLQSIVSIAISFSNPIYVNTYNLQSVYTDSSWSRTISVTPFVLVVAEVFSSDQSFSQNITEYVTVNPYAPVQSKEYNLFGWILRFPLVASASIQSDNLYVLADNQNTNQVGVLCFKSLQPQVSSLYYIGIVNATSTDTLTVSSASYFNDYVLVVNKADGTIHPFFIPSAPYVTIKPPTLENPLQFTQILPFNVLVNSMNATQNPLNINAKLLVVNPQTVVNVAASNDNLLFDSNKGYINTLWVDDSKWATGSLFGYNLVGGTGQTFTDVINHLSAGQTDIYGLVGVTALLALEDNQNFLALTAAAVVYQLNSSYSISAKPVSLPIDTDVYSCSAMTPIYAPQTTDLLVLLTFCQQRSSKQWYVFPVSYASIDPFPLGSYALTLLPDLNPNHIVWYDNYLYILNAPQNPVKGRPGDVYVYSIDFSEQGSADLQIVLGPNTFNVSSEFSVASFLIMPAGANEVAQLFLLDGFGNGVIYATYNTQFNGEGPYDFIYSSLTWDIYDQLRTDPINAYLPDVTIYYDLISVGSPSISTNDITYSVALLTDLTPIYEFRLTFTIPSNTNNSRPLSQPPTLTRVYGTFNGVYQTVNNLKYYNNTLFCPFYNPIKSTTVFLAYNMLYVPPNSNLTLPVLTPAQAGYTVTGAANPATSPYILYQTPNANNNSPQIVISANQNYLSSVNYNSKLGLLFTNTTFKITDVLLTPLALTSQKLQNITVSVNNTEPGPGPGPSPSPSPTVSPTPSTPTTSSGGGGKGLLWLWILLGVVGGIALIGVAVWFFRRKKLTDQHQPLNDPIEAEDSNRN